MTTRGQKKTIDASQSNTSENGTILNLLTGGDPVVISETNTPENVQRDAPQEKDITKGSSGDPAKAKDPILQAEQTSTTVPAIAEIQSERD